MESVRIFQRSHTLADVKFVRAYCIYCLDLLACSEHCCSYSVKMARYVTSWAKRWMCSLKTLDLCIWKSKTCNCT